MKLRTLDKGYEELLRLDPETSLTKHGLRQALLEGRVPSIMIASKRLFDIDEVFLHLSRTSEVAIKGTKNRIRRIEQ